MAFSDLCHISNAYKSVENDPDQSERIMEENSMVRDLITKILDETGPAEGGSSIQPPEKTVSSIPNQYPNNDPGTFAPPNYNANYQNNMFNYQNEQNGFNYNLQNGFGNGFVNYNDNDVGLLGVDTVDASTDVTPEQLNLLRLAAQEIGGAQFSNPNKFDEKFYNFFEPSQRNSMPESNMFSVNNFNRPNSLNLEMNYNTNFESFNNAQRFPNKFDSSFAKDQSSQDSADILAYLNQLNLSLDRRDEMPNNVDFRTEMNGHYQNEDFNKMQDQKMFFNRNFQTPPKNFNGENFFLNDMMMNERPITQSYDYSNQTPVSASNSMNFKPNGFNQNEFMRNQMPMNQANGMNEQQRNFENSGGNSNMQQAMMRQNQELARQMSLLMRNRPPPNQLNVDVSFLHENTPFNMGLGALLGPSPPVAPPPVLQSPMLDLPLLAPFYAMRNMRGAATSSGILHARLDACYEQWRQLERERKRTEARLALAYPGRAVSSSNSIPVPRLPPCPSRVDRLTVDMLREHTKVLTLMGKMETLRASVCVAQNKKPNKAEDGKITVLKRGQENVASEERRDGVDPASFDPTSWRDDVKNLTEIAPHSEVESAMLSWRSAVAAVQAARRRELAPHQTHPHARFTRQDPILQLAEAVKQLGICARRARCAMWCDLTLTVALAPPHTPLTPPSAPVSSSNVNKAAADNSHSVSSSQPPGKQADSSAPSKNDKQTSNDAKENKTPNEITKTDNKVEPNNNKATANKQDKPTEKTARRAQHYRKVQRDVYRQRYDHRLYALHGRHPGYLATGPIN